MSRRTIDLSSISKFLIDLLRRSIEESPDWQKPVPLISPLPPDEVFDGTALGLHLFHASEEPAHSNSPDESSSQTGQRIREVRMKLSYMLTAYHESGDDSSLWDAQLLMGLAQEAFRGNPVEIIEDHQGSARSRVSIAAWGGGPSEILEYWSNFTSTPRLSAGYQIRVDWESEVM